MFFFIKLFVVLFSFIELTPFIDMNSSNQNNTINLFLIIFIISYLFNIFLDQKSDQNLNFDLIFKYFILFFKNPSYFANYILNIFKKIFLFLYHFKYRHFRLSSLIFLKKYLLSFLIVWRPLFKKTSYFGYFRSNRSKWIK